LIDQRFLMYSSRRSLLVDFRARQQASSMRGELRERVRERYAEVARSVRSGSRALDSEAPEVDWTGGSYSETEKRELPQAAVEASLGCGNPVALATFSPGEVVLELGSGVEIDVLLSARRVAPGGMAYGLDMTDETLELARENQRKAGVENAEFLKGEIEDIPLPDDHVDVVISNRVINLSTAKERVIGEAFRVLKPGGRFAASETVFLGDKSKLPAEVVRSVELWAGCVSGALEKEEYEALQRGAGFEDVSVEVTHTYDVEAGSSCCGESGCCGDAEALREVPWPARLSGPVNRSEGEGMAGRKIQVLEENGAVGGEQVERIVALGQALSDPVRVRMLGMIAGGRNCCDLPDLGVPAEEEEKGICVCEFEGYYGMGQSRVSYHLGKRKEAGLVREERRGKWSFYPLDREAAGQLLAEAGNHLGVRTRRSTDA
jgi:arsenite methyltransferase